MRPAGSMFSNMSEDQISTNKRENDSAIPTVHQIGYRHPVFACTEHLKNVVASGECTDMLFESIHNLQKIVNEHRDNSWVIDYLVSVISDDGNEKLTRQLILATLGRSKSATTKSAVISQIYSDDDDVANEAIHMSLFNEYRAESYEDERMFWWQFIANDFREVGYGRTPMAMNLLKRYLVEVEGFDAQIDRWNRLLKRGDITIDNFVPPTHDGNPYFVPNDFIERRIGERIIQDPDVKKAVLDRIRLGRISCDALEHLEKNDIELINVAKSYFSLNSDAARAELACAINSSFNPTAIPDLKSLLVNEVRWYPRKTILQLLATSAQKDASIYSILAQEHSMNPDHANEVIEIIGSIRSEQSMKILQDIHSSSTLEMQRQIDKYLQNM